MPRGGRRQGQPGRAYTNRGDLNRNRAALSQQAPSEQYGQRVAQQRATQAVPMAPPSGPSPDDVPSLADPTSRPDEPLTAGIASGPGPGPEILPNFAGDPADELRALYQRYPSEELRRIIEELEQG